MEKASMTIAVTPFDLKVYENLNEIPDTSIHSNLYISFCCLFYFV